MTEPDESPAGTVHDGWSRRNFAQPADPAVRLGPGGYVDKIVAPCHERRHQYGYVARWHARRHFLDAVVRVRPDCLSELLEDRVLDMVMPPVPALEVSIFAADDYGTLLEAILFNREDNLFADVDWVNFDPNTHPSVALMDDNEQRIVKGMGWFPIAQAWGFRELISESSSLSIKDFLRILSFAKDDGQGFLALLEEVTEDLGRFLDDWDSRWNLYSAWSQMLAALTICEAATRRTQHEPLPSSFIFRERLILYHTELADTPITASNLSVRIKDAWNPRKEIRNDARQRILRLVEAELDRIEAAVAAVSEPTPTKIRPVHFEWLARYQLNGESYQDIARNPGYNSRKKLMRQSVTDAIESTAELVGLELRYHGLGGRPRTTSPA